MTTDYSNMTPRQLLEEASRRYWEAFFTEVDGCYTRSSVEEAVRQDMADYEREVENHLRNLDREKRAVEAQSPCPYCGTISDAPCWGCHETW